MMKQYRTKPVSAYQFTWDILEAMVFDGKQYPGLHLGNLCFHPERRLIYHASVFVGGNEFTPLPIGDWVVKYPNAEKWSRMTKDTFEDLYYEEPGQ